MNEIAEDPKWMTGGLAVATSIITFRLISGVLEILHFQIQRIPLPLVRTLGTYSVIIIPAIAVACAVLISRWPEKKLDGARRKTKVGILVVLLVLAFLPLQFRIEATVPWPPLERMETP